MPNRSMKLFMLYKIHTSPFLWWFKLHFILHFKLYEIMHLYVKIFKFLKKEMYDFVCV